ncbi:MAG: hypothetical protein GY943_00210, partial [Chloroflexi bacterium]|nr:hypothetical protein [Chloroflexota bacterium]
MLQKLSPIQILLFGFILLAIVGAGLLMLPIMNNQAEGQPFVDALFMSTSAVTTTGLGVISTGSYYNPLGQFIILILLQIGGVGYMTLIVFIMQLFGQSLSFQGGNLMEESLTMPSRGEMRHFVKRVVLFTLLFEGLGAIGLTAHWLHEYSFLRALYLGVFHSISAFCTAGFALFGDGFSAYEHDWYFNIVINLISTAGAVGFFVLSEAHLVLKKLWQQMRPHLLTMHTKFAFIVTGVLIFMGTVILFAVEFNGNARWDAQLLSASFQAITAVSTTGFNTTDLNALQPASQFVMSTLMFIGAPAGGTGGGIKSTTFGVLLLLLWAVLHGEKDVHIFERRLADRTWIKSVSIALTAMIWLVVSVGILSVTETAVPFLSLVFEASSALGT